MTDRPQPTIDEHGVGWCSEKCGHYQEDRDFGVGTCQLMELSTPYAYSVEGTEGNICEPWAREMVRMRVRDDDGKLGALRVLLGVNRDLRASLRKVQRAARRWASTPYAHTMIYEGCHNCYRALPESGECRCGGEG